MVIHSSRAGLGFWIPRFEFKRRFIYPYVKSLLLPIPVPWQWAVEGGGAMQVLWWCSLSVPCLPRGILHIYIMYIIFSGIFLSSSFFSSFFSHVFAVPLVACGSSNSMNIHNCSVKSGVHKASSSTSEVLLSKIFLGLQN